MRISAAAARDETGQRLVRSVVERASAGMSGHKPDLAVVFATADLPDLEQVGESVRRMTGARAVVGCSAQGVIGPEREEETGPAIALWLGQLPDTVVRPFHLVPEQIESADSAAAWRTRLGAGAEAEPSFLLFGDPYTVDVNALLGGVNEFLPGRPVIGGMASGAGRPGQSALWLDEEVHAAGAVGVMLAGATEIQPLVSQGCRPVGQPCVITRAERNVIQQLGGRKPIEVLNEFFEAASEADKQAMRQGLLIGRVINEQKGSFGRGDFLIRNLMGADRESGAIAVGDYVRVGITVQFQVRDAAAAHEDLEMLLAGCARPQPAGALLFSCNGRGSRMFDVEHHDVGVTRQALGGGPVAGFFCAGELGPIGGKNFIHGHTASLALFRQRSAGSA